MIPSFHPSTTETSAHKYVYLRAEGSVILDKTEYLYEAFVAAWEIVYFNRERAFIKKII
jgi:hypothetical protein